MYRAFTESNRYTYNPNSLPLVLGDKRNCAFSFVTKRCRQFTNRVRSNVVLTRRPRLLRDESELRADVKLLARSGNKNDRCDACSSLNVTVCTSTSKRNSLHPDVAIYAAFSPFSTITARYKFHPNCRCVLREKTRRTKF